MKRKLAMTLLTLTLALCSILGLTACGHEHSYTTSVTAPTCTEKGYTTYTCSCGDSYVDDYVDELGHEYGAYISNGDGTHTKTCANDNSHKLTEDCTFDSNKACKECGYITTALLGTEISSDVFTINGTNLYVKVPNNQEIFYFVDTVEVADGATYGFYTNIQGTDYISSYITDLNDGDNKFYMIVNNNGALPKTYTVVIRRRPMYEVTFNSNGGSAVSKQAVEEDFWATEPTTTRAGYDFDGWDYDFTTPITKNTEINAIWTARDDTPYKIEYYLQNLADDEYTLIETITETGVTDTDTITAEVKTYDHFTYNQSKSILRDNINGNGSTVLKVYYTRDKYSVSLNTYNSKAGSVTGNGNYKYEKEITVTATTNAGYTFLGWYNGEERVCETEEFTFSVQENITYTAKWSANTVSYKIEYYLQNLADDSYTLSETITETGVTDTTATIEPKDITHFTFNEGYALNVLESNINDNGSTVLKLYYKRDKYDITVNGNNAKAGTFTNASGNYKYEKEITLTATTKAGYTFLGWFDGDKCLCENAEYKFNVDKAITITAKWTANTVSYKIEYYLQNLANDSYTLSETITETGVTDTDTITAEVKPFDHYTYNQSKSILRDNINGNGSTVLKVYYTRDKYSVSLNTDNSKAGSVTGSGNYKYEKEITVKATTNIGYTFLGWFDGETCVCETAEFTFKVEKAVAYVAKFEVKEEMTNFNFTSTTTSCSITSIKDETVTEIIVPDYVTSISRDAFRDCKSLTSVIIGDSVTSIGSSAFSGCTSLTSIEIPNSVKSIGYGAFYSCKSLTSVVIGDSVESIGERAFYGCTSLTSVVIGNSVTSIGSSAFRGCTSLTSVVIGDSVESIGSYAFSSCSSLTSIEIPDNVTSIGDRAFSGCSSLESIDVEENNPNYKSIDGNLYSKDGKTLIIYAIGKTATTFTIPNSVESIGSSAFYGCYSLTSIEIPDSVTSIGERAFYYCSSLTSIEIPDSVTSIFDYAFYNCYKFTSVIIGDSVTSIGSHAFYWCSSLTSVEIPASVTSIGDYAFYNCDSLTSVVIGDSVTSIGEDAFDNCDSLTSVVIGNSVTSIVEDAFYGCTSLTSVVIGNSVKSIGYGAFYNCYSLTSVVIGDSVTSIGYEAFYNCGSLKTVYYSGTAEDWSKISISSNNSSLTSATRYYYVEKESDVPNLWGEYWHYNAKGEIELWLCDHNYINGICERCGFSNLAFKLNNDGKGYTVTGVGECTDSSIIIPSTYKNKPVTSIGSSAFRGCTSLTSVVIGNSVTSIGSSAFYNCSSLTSIEIPNSVTSIGNGAFYDCDSLTSIDVEENNPKYKSIDGNLYSKDGKTLIIYAIGKTATTFTIPNSVESIGSSAFSNCDSLTSIEIPNSVTSIGSSAFSNCSSLTSIEIPDSVTSIGYSAFYYCRSLTSVEIPDSVTSIGEDAFYNCDSLTSVVIGDNVTSIGNSAFEDCDLLTSVVIGDSVTSIGEDAFYICYKLVEVINKSAHITIGKGSSYNGYVGYYALVVYNSDSGITGSQLINDNGYIVYTEGNEKILVGYSGEGTSLVLPTYITKINSYAFSGCTSLTSVVIGNSVTSIVEDAFNNCGSLTTIYYSGTAEDWSKISISSNNSSLTSATRYYYVEKESDVPNLWGEYWHYNAKGEIELWLCDHNYINGICERCGFSNLAFKLNNDGKGYTVTVVGECTVRGIIIPSTYKNKPVTSIGERAFYGCTSLTSVVIGNSVTSIGSSAFRGCTSLTSVVIGDNVTSIGSSAFYECSSLTSVVIGNSVTSIGAWAFYNCSKLTSIVIPDSVESIGIGAFRNCSLLTSIVIPDNVTSIGSSAFEDCGKLTSIVIPNSVTSIGDWAFFNCRSLTSIKYRGTESQWQAITKGSGWNSNTGKYTITYNYTGE